MARKRRELTPDDMERIKEEAIDGEFRDVGKEKGFEEMTPAEYFTFLKEKAASSSDLSETLMKAIIAGEKRVQKFEKLGQKTAAETTKLFIKMFEKECKIYDAGYRTYVLKDDVDKYIKLVKGKKNIFMAELSEYPRELPDDVFDKTSEAIECGLFDHLYVLFTDYTKKTAKEIMEVRKEKDPILFGAINLDNRSKSSSNPVIGPRYYFIADWVDEYCDLTISEFLNTFTDNDQHSFELPDITDAKSLEEAVNRYRKEFKD